jgi:hypothetical protein
LVIASSDFKYWTKIAIGLWNSIPDLDLETIPLLVGIRFTRIVKNTDINLQLYDLSWDNKYVYEEKYILPDRISFGDPGRLFEEE